MQAMSKSLSTSEGGTSALQTSAAIDTALIITSPSLPVTPVGVSTPYMTAAIRLPQGDHYLRVIIYYAPLAQGGRVLFGGRKYRQPRGLTRLFVEPLLRAMMDIRAHPISLADRPVTAIVTRRQGLPRKKPRLPTLSVKRLSEASPIFA